MTPRPAAGVPPPPPWLAAPARARFALLCAVLACALTAPLRAEPYLAVAQGFKCSRCHVNPTGGGMRNASGDVFAQTLLPARHRDIGSAPWAGAITRFLALGGDLRFDAHKTQQPRGSPPDESQLSQTRLYLDASVIPGRLIQQASGINMTTPDQGVEFGWLRGHWDGQLAASNGTAGAAASGNGKQASAQAAWVEGAWRAGAALNYDDAAPGGSRRAYGVFGGLRTGPIAWLGQAELIDDRSVPGATGSGVKMLATLVEADWSPARGHDRKITGEYLDPDRRIANDARTRWSLAYELTPLQFVQLRAGVRYGDGIPQLPAEHQRLYFLELHGFF